MGREDESDEEVYRRYVRVRNQAVASQQHQARSLSPPARSFSAPNVIPIERWRTKLTKRRVATIGYPHNLVRFVRGRRASVSDDRNITLPSLFRDAAPRG
jgi:hypothetical protein